MPTNDRGPSARLTFGPGHRVARHRPVIDAQSDLLLNPWAVPRRGMSNNETQQAAPKKAVDRRGSHYKWSNIPPKPGTCERQRKWLNSWIHVVLVPSSL